MDLAKHVLDKPDLHLLEEINVNVFQIQLVLEKETSGTVVDVLIVLCGRNQLRTEWVAIKQPVLQMRFSWEMDIASHAHLAHHSPTSQVDIRMRDVRPELNVTTDKDMMH